MQECAVHFCRRVSGSEPLDILWGRKGGELCQSGIHDRIYRRFMIPISLRSFLNDPFGIVKREREGKTDRYPLQVPPKRRKPEVLSPTHTAHIPLNFTLVSCPRRSFR